MAAPPGTPATGGVGSQSSPGARTAGAGRNIPLRPSSLCYVV